MALRQSRPGISGLGPGEFGTKWIEIQAKYRILFKYKSRTLIFHLAHNFI